jgi:hypothetical protein
MKNRVSDNVGGVKHFSSTRLHALGEERHFALVDGVAFPTVGSRVIVFRSGTRSDPCISSVCNCDHDYYFELLSEEERAAQSITRCSYCTPSPGSSWPACEPNFLTCS